MIVVDILNLSDVRLVMVVSELRRTHSIIRHATHDPDTLLCSGEGEVGFK